MEKKEEFIKKLFNTFMHTLFHRKFTYLKFSLSRAPPPPTHEDIPLNVVGKR